MICSRLFRFLHSIWCSYRAKHISIGVDELFFQQIKNGEFNRYDTIVRLLAIEDYYQENGIGFGLYKRMQCARLQIESADSYIDNFIELIKSYEIHGYNNQSEISLNADLTIIDGSHRFAMALYHKLPTISAKVYPNVRDVFYGIDWFRINGFSEKECLFMTNRFLSLKESFTTPFICTLWHPARLFFDDITQNLSLFGEIRDIKDFCLNKWEYDYYTRGIYAVDDIAKWKIEKKLEYMTQEGGDSYQIRMVSIIIDNPDFRLKKVNYTTLSRKGEQIKKLVRDAYKNKIDNYFYDIIIHIGDNFYQNKYIYKLLSMPQIDVKSILDHIHDYKYVITKMDVPFMPKDFPAHYPLGKDVDIICADEKEYASVVESVKNDLQEYEVDYQVRIVKECDKNGKEYRSLLRLELEQYLVFLFDISCRIGRLADAFTKEMIANRCEVDGLFIPSLKYEILVRLDTFHNNMTKSYHLEYIKAHKDYIDAKLTDKYLHFNWRELL